MTTAASPRPSAPAVRRSASDVAEVKRAIARAEGGRKWIVRLVVLAVIAAAAALFVRWRMLHPAPKAPRYMTEEVSRGDVLETIQTTGTVQPVTQVQVGAQVSGKIKKLYVDFNSTVKKDELVAEIDPTLYQANVARDRANVATAQSALEGARASLDLAVANYDRAKLLNSQGLLGQADLVTAKGNYELAVANLHGAEAGLVAAQGSLKNSITNLAYTKIYAPIDGVVVNRAVDEGQTVAASFQAPVLFTIAQDLRHMNALADVDEADLGRLAAAKDPLVDVQVPAFPGDTFKGRLSEVRYNSTTTQGVVTYPAVIDIENNDLKLRPGMTATISIRTAEAKGAVRVPNAALRFKPTPPLGPDGKPGPTKPEPPLPKGKGRVFLPPEANPQGEATARVVDVGVSDGLFTVIESGLAPGEKVVVDESDDAKPAAPKRGLF